MRDIEGAIENFIDTLPCQSNKPFPPIKVAAKNATYADLLLDAYAKSCKSELTAINQYFYHHLTIPEDEIKQTLMCIAIVEMKHLEVLGELIKLLGKEPKFYNSEKSWWSGGEVGYGDSLCYKLQIDILSEEGAIAFYKTIITKIEDKYIQCILQKIIEDEQVHLKTFKLLLEKYCNNCNCQNCKKNH